MKTIVRYGFVKPGGMVGDKLLGPMGCCTGEGLYSIPILRQALKYTRPWAHRGPAPDDEVGVGREVIVAAMLLTRLSFVPWGLASG